MENSSKVTTVLTLEHWGMKPCIGLWDQKQVVPGLVSMSLSSGKFGIAFTYSFPRVGMYIKVAPW